MDRAHGPVVALRHRQEHREDLGAPNLTDDHPLRVHPQCGSDQVGECEGSDPLGVGLASFEGLVVGVELVEAFEADLE